MSDKTVMYKDEIEKARLCWQAGRPIPFEKLCDFALQHAEERPEKKVIDLSVLIESGVDCTAWSVGTRPRVESGLSLKMFDRFEPRMNHLHAWDGGMDKCPIPSGFDVDMICRDGSIPTKSYEKCNWSHNQYGQGILGSDIIAFKILRKLDNYRYPWEAEE